MGLHLDHGRIYWPISGSRPRRSSSRHDDQRFRCKLSLHSGLYLFSSLHSSFKRCLLHNSSDPTPSNIPRPTCAWNMGYCGNSLLRLDLCTQNHLASKRGHSSWAVAPRAAAEAFQTLSGHCGRPWKIPHGLDERSSGIRYKAWKFKRLVPSLPNVFTALKDTEFLCWAFLNKKDHGPEDDDELEEYAIETEVLLGRKLDAGWGDAVSLRVTIDRFQSLHRSLLWYLVSHSSSSHVGYWWRTSVCLCCRYNHLCFPHLAFFSLPSSFSQSLL